MAFSAKVASFFILFAMTLLFGLLPFVLIKCLDKSHVSKRRTEHVVSVLNCFAGGVFFGTAILHLLPESMEEVEKHILSDYPVASALVGAGFFLVLSVEHIIGTCNGDAHSHGHSHNYEQTRKQTQDIPEDDNLTGSVKKNQLPNSLSPDKENAVAGISFIKTSLTESGNLAQPTSEQRLGTNSNEPTVNIKISNTKSNGGYTQERHSRLRAFILVLALSLHMVFEGLAVGLQETNEEVWKLLGILTLHKCIVAFSTGLQLEETLHSFKKVLISMMGFSVVAPLGVGIGFLVTEFGGEGEAQGIASGVLQSLATGTFFYITFFEILQKELANRYNLLKVLFTIIGFLVIIAVQFLPDEDDH